MYTYRVKGYWCLKSLPVIKCDTLLQPLITLKLWRVCADENPASLQQGVYIWSRCELCFSRGLSWWRANPLFLPRLFLEAWGLIRYFDLGDTAVEKSPPNYIHGAINPYLFCAFPWFGQWCHPFLACVRAKENRLCLIETDRALCKSEAQWSVSVAAGVTVPLSFEIIICCA